MSSSDDIRYSRQLTLPSIGQAGQARLSESRALLIGAGGLGNPAGLYLARAGLGHITVCDFDTVDLSNLPRQIMFDDTDAGKPKAEVLAVRLNAANPDTKAIGFSRRLNRDMLAAEVDQADIVLDCTDNFASRWLINAVCFEQRTPLVSGAAIRFEGQLSVFRPDLEDGPCYRCLYAEEDENLNDCAGQGILGPVAGMVGCMMATETLKALLGIATELQGKLWLYDGMAGSSRLVKINTQAGCPVCGVAS